MSRKVHVFATLAENKGIWFTQSDEKATEYRSNGYNELLGNRARRNRYRRPRSILTALKNANKGRGTQPSSSLPAIAQYSEAHVLRYYFEFVGVDTNFLHAKSPYENQAHHLIPQNTYTSLFGQRERDMLKRVDYDVHNGKNIIFLPVQVDDTAFHELPHHNGEHDAYDWEVVDDAKELGQDLRELGDEACDDKALQDIKQQLMDLQEKYWNLLANAPPIAVRSLRRRQVMDLVPFNTP